MISIDSRFELSTGIDSKLLFPPLSVSPYIIGAFYIVRTKQRQSLSLSGSITTIQVGAY